MNIQVPTTKYRIPLVTFQIWWLLDGSICSGKYLQDLRYIEPVEAVDFSPN